MRRYRVHLSVFDTLDDVIDETALVRNVASAVPDVLFRERYELPVPRVVLDEIERIAETNELAAGRPALVPEEH